MIEQIPLQPVPNQSLSVRLNGSVYAIEINTRRDNLYATVRVDNELIATNRRLVSYSPIEGDLMIVDTEGQSDPNWQELGSRYQLMYWTLDDE